MAGQKACKNCKTIFQSGNCPKCGSNEATDSFKGRAVILDAEQSEIAKNMKIKDKGVYAIKA